VADVAPTLQRLAERLGVNGGGAIEEHPQPKAAITAFVPIWKRPWMTIGGDTYASSLLLAAGVANAFADAPGRYPVVDDLGSVTADVVLAPSEPFPFGERHVPDLAVVAPVVLLDGRDLFWWGTRTAEGLRRLRELANTLPESFR
jgi:hypothetical protein